MRIKYKNKSYGKLQSWAATSKSTNDQLACTHVLHGHALSDLLICVDHYRSSMT
jgi:hypothetical protein